MDEREIRRHLNEWIINFVEVPNKLLNDWAPCPYARQARIENKIQVFVVEDITCLEKTITDTLKNLEIYDVIIFCLDHNKIEGADLAKRVDKLNATVMPQNYVLLEDHPSVPEILNDAVMNFGHCALVLCQKLNKLQDASNQLKKKGYYDSWPKSNLDYVLNWRNK